MDSSDTITEEVCREDDVGDGQLLEVMVAGYPVLLVRNRKEFRALGSKCPHYGAPLSKGVLRGERLRCPWHGACFNVRTGDIEEYPALDCIPCFKVTVEDGKVFITAKKKDLESSLRVKDTSRRCLLNKNTMLLLGGGVAALVCAETLRQEGFTGRIIMATNEKHVPYDKSKLSKEMNLKAEDIYLRKPEFLEARGIELWTEKEAVSVDFQKQKVRFMDGSSQKYHQLLIATGSHSGFLKVPGADLQNICTLQSPEDSSKILELATGKNLVIVGASFIGMEVAAFLSDKAGTISVVEREEFPYQHALGPQVGGVAMKMLQNKGVKFHMKTELCELKGKDGKVTEAVLANGEHLPADVVVVGIGSVPNSVFLKGTSIARDDKGAILVNLHMQTNIPNVFAAGDVVTFPVALLDGDSSSIRHQQVAEAHGRCAALNMLRRGKELHTVPYFWSTLLGKSIRYAGRKGQREGNRISSHQLGLGLAELTWSSSSSGLAATVSLSPGPAGHPELLFFADLQCLGGHRGGTSLSKAMRGSKSVLFAPVTVPPVPPHTGSEVGSVAAAVPGLPEQALSHRLWEGIHGHCCEGKPGATEIPDLLHQVSESMASPCLGNRAQSSLLQPAEIPQRLHISWLSTKGSC
ncbi:apoptosis-inducing factor 3-like isoform X1 [Catharus ustulatus]|uniref:apoptosis-inducing factor 3-like isoform X1 n=1 Tax=Catharus ustulatus TaxID=91951 RepID=UPI00140AA474|nr:apoptosis-inducing factor 3-like isoform X1 [Catharus ustulatus]